MSNKGVVELFNMVQTGTLFFVAPKNAWPNPPLHAHSHRIRHGSLLALGEIPSRLDSQPQPAARPGVGRRL